MATAKRLSIGVKQIRRPRENSSFIHTRKVSPMARMPLPEKHAIMRVMGQVIRENRVKRGLSQDVLAGTAGVDRTYLSQIERGNQSPTVVSLWKLSKALQISTSTLMAGLDERLR